MCTLPADPRGLAGGHLSPLTTLVCRASSPKGPPGPVASATGGGGVQQPPSLPRAAGGQEDSRAHGPVPQLSVKGPAPPTTPQVPPPTAFLADLPGLHHPALHTLAGRGTVRALGATVGHAGSSGWPGAQPPAPDAPCLHSLICELPIWGRLWVTELGHVCPGPSMGPSNSYSL